jgi:hypothetical protein
MKMRYDKGGRKPDFLDLDKDGNRTEPMANTYMGGGKYYKMGGEYGYGGKYEDGGDYDPKKQAKHMRDLARFDMGFDATMKKELRRRDRDVRRSGPDELGFYPQYEQEVSVLLDMLENDQLGYDEMVQKGRRRRGAQQAAALLSELGLAGFAGGKVAQIEAERLTGNRPKFGRALLMALGII